MAPFAAIVALLPWLHQNCFRASSDRHIFPSCVFACTLILLCASCCSAVLSPGFLTQACLVEDGSKFFEKRGSPTTNNSIWARRELQSERGHCVRSWLETVLGFALSAGERKRGQVLTSGALSVAMPSPLRRAIDLRGFQR